MGLSFRKIILCRGISLEEKGLGLWVIIIFISMDIVILDNDVIYMCTFIIYSNFYPALYNSIYTTLMLPITMPTDPTS